MNCLTFSEIFDSDLIHKTYEIIIVTKFDMFVMTWVNLNEKGVFPQKMLILN